MRSRTRAGERARDASLDPLLRRSIRAADVFPVAPFAVSLAVGADAAPVPSGVVHAKTMGTNSTLCGVGTTSWVKFWDQRFDHVMGERCRECNDAFHQLVQDRAVR